MAQEATIRRGVRNARYAAIPNHVFEDSRLSMEARWLLGYLLSKPDNWTVVIGDIIKKGNCGRDKARKMIAELVEFGYAEREQSREDGKFGSSILVIYDEPSASSVGIHSDISGGSESVAFLPQTDLPATAEPAPVSPSPVKSALSNNLDLANTDHQKREGGREDFQVEDQKGLEKRYKALEIGLHSNPWPLILKSSSDWGLKRFLELSPDERRLAEERRDAYLAACPKVQRGERKGEPDAVPLGVYLRDRKFLDVAAIAPRLVSPAVRPVNVPVAPFGPVWAGMRARALLQGPVSIDVPLDVRDVVRQMFDMHRKASEARAMSYLQGKGISLGADGELVFPGDFYQQEAMRRTRDSGYPEVNRLHRLAASRASCMADPECAIYRDLCEPVPVGSDLFREWRAHDDAHGYPALPDHGAMSVVWFPKGGPEGLQEFQDAVTAAMSKGQGDEHAA